MYNNKIKGKYLMPKVLVTSGNTRVAYAICQNLAEKGFEVYIGDRTSFTMAGMSRYCKGRMTYPSPFTEQENFINSIIDFMKENKIDILLPVLEETFTCLKNKNILEKANLAFLFPGYEKALLLHAKGTLTTLANELAIDTPKTWELAEIFSETFNKEDLIFPIIVKPKQGGGGWGMQRFNEFDEFYSTITQEISNPENYIVQRIIIGDLVGACGIYYQGKHIASDSYKLTTNYPLYVGQSTTRMTHYYPTALDSFKKLLSHLEWNGVCQMDFIYDTENNKSYLIDVNPRFWGSVKHNIAAGFDYPYYYALLAQNSADFAIPKAKEGTRTRWLGGDILRIVAEFRESTNKLQYIKKIFFEPTHYSANDDWNIKDPLPFITWGINLILNKILKRKKDALPGVWK